MEHYDGSQLFKKAMERLNERQKELTCLYHVLEILRDISSPLEDVLYQVLEKIPAGWQYPSVCEARITIDNKVIHTSSFRDSTWRQTANLVVDNSIIGTIEVFYTQFIREINNSQFLPEEQKLLNTIADKISDHIFFRRLSKSIDYLETGNENLFVSTETILSAFSDEHWKWRMHMAELLASRLPAKSFGVKALYLIGSVKNGTSGPASDIDLLVHFIGDEKQQCQLRAWLDGWSTCLAEINFQRTGYKMDELLELHFISDGDIEKKDSYALMINAIDNRAKPLHLSKDD